MAKAAGKKKYQTLLVEHKDGLTTVTLNRPRKRNAMSPQLHREMYTLLNELHFDEKTRVIVITGAGESFCAGQDLKEYFVELDKEAPEVRAEVKRMSKLWRNDLIRHLPKPVIASINGWCFGGAFTVVTACDVAVAAEDAVFGLSEVNFGFFPGGDVTKVLTEHLHPKHALYYSLTGKTFDAREAERMGLITKAVPRAELARETQAIADSLLEKDPLALQAVKEAWHHSVGVSDQVAYELAMLLADRVKTAQGGRPGIDQFARKKYRPGLSAYQWKKKK